MTAPPPIICIICAIMLIICGIIWPCAPGDMPFIISNICDIMPIIWGIV